MTSTRDRALAPRCTSTPPPTRCGSTCTPSRSPCGPWPSGPARTPRPGAWSACCTTSTTSAFPTPPTPRPRSTRPKACGILARAGLPEPMQRAILGHANYTGVPRDTPMARALFAVDELCRLPGGLRAGAPVAEPAGPRGLQRQEEAQGQGLCPGREPGGRDPRAPRSSASRSTSTSPSCSQALRPHERTLGLGSGVTGDRPGTAEQSVACAINRAAGGPAGAGQQGRPAHRRPRHLRGHAGADRRGRPLDPLRELHHPERHGRAGASPTR